MRNFKADLSTIIEETGVNKIVGFPFRETESLRATNIDFLCLNARASNGLRRQGVTTIGGLIDNWNKIPVWRGLGAASVKEIKSSFYSYYYSTLSDDEVKNFWVRFVEMNATAQA